MENPSQPVVTPNAPESAAPFAGALAKDNTAMSAKKMFLPLLIVMIFLGVATGYGVSALTTTQAVPTQKTLEAQTQSEDNAGESPTQATKVGQVVGAKDASAFKDTVEGVLVPGGVDGEGSHHIVRVGGASQNVYLTSSVMDLKIFEGARVRVSGETFKAQKAGWLMDVGRVEVKELNAPLPDGAKAPTAPMQDE